MAHTAGEMEERSEDEAQDMREGLISTRNDSNPWDLTTPFGIFATTYAVLSCYDDREALWRLTIQPVIAADDNAVALAYAREQREERKKSKMC